MKLTNEKIEVEFEAWWEKTGRFYDPDFEEVPWFDKRKGLAAKAYRDALCAAARPEHPERQVALEELYQAEHRCFSAIGEVEVRRTEHDRLAAYNRLRSLEGK